MTHLLVSTLEAAAQLGVGRTTLYGLIALGELNAVKIGRRTLLPQRELEAYTVRLQQGSARRGAAPAAGERSERHGR